jgi:hypothetical protein
MGCAAIRTPLRLGFPGATRIRGRAALRRLRPVRPFPGAGSLRIGPAIAGPDAPGTPLPARRFA